MIFKLQMVYFYLIMSATKSDLGSGMFSREQQGAAQSEQKAAENTAQQRVAERSREQQKAIDYSEQQRTTESSRSQQHQI